MHQLLSALEHCHSNACEHSDLKLDNIMCASPPPEDEGSELPVLKLIDFGNAQRISVQTGKHSQVATDDMWHAGLIFFQLITGQCFFVQDLIELESLEDQGVFVDPGSMTCGSEYVALQMNVARKFCDPMTLDLLGKMLKPDKAARISAQDALEHPFVRAAAREDGKLVRKASFSSGSTTVGSFDESEIGQISDEPNHGPPTPSKAQIISYTA